MIGLQLAAGTLMIAWAVARFRPAYRNQEGQGGDDDTRSPGWLRGRFRPRLRRRPPAARIPCSGRSSTRRGPAAWRTCWARSIALGLVALIGYGTYQFARPAFLEWFEHGLGPATSDIQRTAFNRVPPPSSRRGSSSSRC